MSKEIWAPRRSRLLLLNFLFFFCFFLGGRNQSKFMFLCYSKNSTSLTKFEGNSIMLAKYDEVCVMTVSG